MSSGSSLDWTAYRRRRRKPTRVAKRQVVKEVAAIAGLAAVYLLAGRAGLAMAFVHTSATAVWPPTGISLAALLLLGHRVWPGVFTGAFFVSITTEGTVATSLGIAAGNTLEAVLAAYLVKRFADGSRAFGRARTVFTFVGLAGLLSTTVSPTFGVTSLSVAGFADWASYGPIWVTWWLGDVTGAIIVAPLLILWGLNPHLRWSPKQSLEVILLLLSILLIGLATFVGLSPSLVKHQSLTFLCIPVLVWAAFRFGQREAATVSFLFSATAIWGTVVGSGPFVSDSPNQSLLLLQVYMAVITVTAIALAAVVSERKRFETQLVHLVDHDPLTQLASARRFYQELERHLAEAIRYGTRGALLYIDLDGFKSVNDTLGHQTGDAFLTDLSFALNGRLRDTDVLARMGGDEFAVILPHADGVSAQVLASQLLDVIRQCPVPHGGRRFSISASIGIALFPEHALTGDELLAHADAAMYEAKGRGRNQFRIYRSDYDSRIARPRKQVN
jgi:diguanylate cyclase (GGDEF)-like protein